jgi:hypothetical protein
MAYNGTVASFFLDLATAEHDFENDTIMIALYENRDVMSFDLEAYTPTGECVGVNYPAGGIEIFLKEGYPKKEGQFALAVRFEDLKFINISASIGAALIYNGENGRAIHCIDFGDNQLVTTSDFNIVFPEDVDPPVNIILIKR